MNQHDSVHGPPRPPPPKPFDKKKYTWYWISVERSIMIQLVLSMRSKGGQWFNTPTCNDHGPFTSQNYVTHPSIKLSQRPSPNCNVNEIPEAYWKKVTFLFLYFGNIFPCIQEKTSSINCFKWNIELLIISILVICSWSLRTCRIIYIICLWHDLYTSNDIIFLWRA